MKARGILNNQRGIAMLETVPLLVIFVTLISFGLGIFGMIHTATLHSIAARTFSFQVYRNRTNLNFYREDGSGLQVSNSVNYSNKGWRYQGIQNESDTRKEFVATVRPIAFGQNEPVGDNTDATNNVSIYELPARNQKISVNPGWVMVGYGICLSASCGN